MGWLRDIWERLLASRREKKMCETEEEEKMCKEKEEEEVVLGDIWGSLASGLVVPPAGCRPKLHSLTAAPQIKSLSYANGIVCQCR